MKLKNYLTILIVLFILLFYNMFCYSFANKRINEGTSYLISNYLQEKGLKDYQYLKATNNKDGSINVFIKTDGDNFYRFVFTNNGGYKILLVDKNIPDHIKK